MKTLRSILTFYKSFVAASSLITLAAMYIMHLYGMGVFNVLFWLKLITLGLIYYVVDKQKGMDYYYYQNLGLSKVFMWVSTVLLDFLLFIFMLILMLIIR